MRQGVFDTPVVVLLPERGSSVRMEVRTPRDAIAAMTRHGLGAYDVTGETWRSTFTLLVRASLDPTLQNLGAARIALEVLASEVSTRH